MGHKKVRIDQGKPVDEVIEHCLLVLEDRNVRVSFLLDLLLQVKWKRLLVELS